MKLTHFNYKYYLKKTNSHLLHVEWRRSESQHQKMYKTSQLLEY